MLFPFQLRFLARVEVDRPVVGQSDVNFVFLSDLEISTSYGRQ